MSCLPDGPLTAGRYGFGEAQPTFISLIHFPHLALMSPRFNGPRRKSRSWGFDRGDRMSDDSTEAADNEQPGDRLNDTPPTPTPAPAPPVTGSAIPLPAVDPTAPTAPAGDTPAPPMAPPVTSEQSVVPPAGPAAGSYALGALSGNPHLGPSSGPAYSAPATGQLPPTWGPPAATGAGTSTGKPGSHRFRNVAAVTGAIVIAVA